MNIIQVYLKPLCRYKSFIFGAVKREFQNKYQNSLLGASWMIINPISMIFVYTVIFSQVMQTKLQSVTSNFSYSIYLCSGILTWGFFSEIVNRSLNVFIENSSLLKKLSFPRLCLPAVVVLNAGLNFSIIFGLFTLFLLVSGNFPGFAYFAILPLLIVLVIFAVGMGITLGVLNVFFRDVGQFFSIFLNFLFWLTPIVYTTNILPVKLQSFLLFNPMATLITSFQTVLVSGMWPDWWRLGYPATLGLILCALGVRLFKKYGGDMVDEL